MKITIIDYEFDWVDDITAWTFDIEDSDYWKIVSKYCGDGNSIRGKKKEVFTDLMRG